VPDTGPHYAAADVFVAPVFYGGGTQNKVLEAGAAGLPVVTTSYTLATLGEDAEGYAVAADAADWGETVAGLLGDPERAATAGRACFETVRRTYSRAPWEDDLRRVEGLVTARRAGWPA
jgi:glycosyltransferase involved in cell wall biosynthesis